MKASTRPTQRLFWAALALSALVAPAVARAVELPGAILFRSATDQLVARESTLDLPGDWQSLTLTFGADQIRTGDYQVNGNIVALLFRDLPYDGDHGAPHMMVLKGLLEGGKRFYGEIFVAERSSEPATAILGRVLSDHAVHGFVHHASFYYGDVRTINGVPVVTGHPLDPNNPCPYGPCWTNGGVGRQLEYYAGGPIQNPGHAYPPAGFMRGVPYEWTRQGQLAAQAVGTLRTQALYDSIDWYRNGGWGFWFFPWTGFIW